MKTVSYTEAYKQVLTPKVVSLLTRIHEYKGEQQAFIKEHDESLQSYKRVAQFDHCKYSNKMEDIVTSDQRLSMLLHQQDLPQNEAEAQLLGYSTLLTIIDENQKFISLQPSMLQQLHQDLYQFSHSKGGDYKTVDNVIMEKRADGTSFVRFYPTPSAEVNHAMSASCHAYHQAIKEGYDPLIVIPMFLLDFLCIHPFMDGNGRMSRIITFLLLQQAQYEVMKYVSLDQEIYHQQALYYESLQASSIDWHKQDNDYEPFVSFFLQMVVKTCRTFQDTIVVPKKEFPSNRARIAYLIKDHLGKISKADLMHACPDISQTTMQRCLTTLVKEHKVIQICKGRYAAYVWNHEDDEIL